MPNRSNTQILSPLATYLQPEDKERHEGLDPKALHLRLQLPAAIKLKH